MTGAGLTVDVRVAGSLVTIYGHEKHKNGADSILSRLLVFFAAITATNGLEPAPGGKQFRRFLLDAGRVVYTIYYTLGVQMPDSFGDYIRKQRDALRQADPKYSVRQVAARIGVQPSYLSKIERGDEAPPSEKTIRALAKELGEDPDVLLALGGKISSDLQAIIRKRPKLFAELLRQLRDQPDHALLRVVREVRDGEW